MTHKYYVVRDPSWTLCFIKPSIITPRLSNLLNRFPLKKKKILLQRTFNIVLSIHTQTVSRPSSHRIYLRSRTVSDKPLDLLNFLPVSPTRLRHPYHPLHTPQLRCTPTSSPSRTICNSQYRIFKSKEEFLLFAEIFISQILFTESISLYYRRSSHYLTVLCHTCIPKPQTTSSNPSSLPYKTWFRPCHFYHW